MDPELVRKFAVDKKIVVGSSDSDTLRGEEMQDNGGPREGVREELDVNQLWGPVNSKM